MTQEEYLKSNLPSGPYYFEQTGIAEITPRPTPATLSLLQRIYGPDGPIQQVYAKFGVRYFPLDVFRIFGNQLFVDREKELKTLLPAYSYFSSAAWRPKLAITQGAWATLKNLIALQKISPHREDNLVTRLDAELKRTAETEIQFQEALDDFLNAYALVFEINLRAEKALERLNQALKKFGFKPSDVLASPPTFDFYHPPRIEFQHVGWQGNSLEFNDTSVFSHQIVHGRAEATDKWWQKLGYGPRSFLETPIVDVLFYNDLREMGRWLAVGHMNRIRSRVFVKAASCGFRKSEHALFADLEEMQVCMPPEATCEKRKSEYENFAAWDFPTVLRSDRVVTSGPKGLGLAPGQATGRLVSSDMIGQATGDIILFTKLLTPDLAVHLNRVKGIVSEQGSVLSHLAILAREKGIPLVAHIRLQALGIKLGEKISIDGSAGTVDVL